ncbi:hypothetical protein Tco_0634470 [Tanacetum coccineum]
MVISSPCLTDIKNWLVQSKRLLIGIYKEKYASGKDMSNRHQELASLEQTTSGKDFSNPLMADSLPKIIWFSTHHAS